ncbi:MAG: tetratricopeptide repeat protein [Pseudoalteromonas spongiae]
MYLITKNIYALLIATATFTANYASADQTTIDEIELASQQNNVAQLTQIANTAKGYDAALVNYRLAIAHNIIGERDKAITLLDSAQMILTDEKLSEDETEVNALLAQVYGYRISIKPITGMYYGIKSSNALESASESDDTNPRVHLIKGIIAYNTPNIFGGSKQQALKSLNTSINHYQNDDNLGYQWGQAEALVWRGLTHLALNDVQSALDDWQASLEIAPNYTWPQMLISNNQG